MIRMKIGIDWDDCIAPFNSIACEMATEEYNITPALTINDITSWDNTGRASVIKEFYKGMPLYIKQSERISDTTKQCIRKLEEIADVYIITACYPEFMGVRAKQIMDAFPELPQDRIILGAAKHLVQFDMVLDDNICNVLNSPAKYPVLMRKPWNADMTGLLSVNDMTEFMLLAMHIITGERIEKIKNPSVIALVGPSGSGKTDVLNNLAQSNKLFQIPKSYTTSPHGKWRTRISEEEFCNTQFCESTRYGGYGYGTKAEDIEEILSAGKCPVIPLDMCGAIGMKRYFPTVIIYLDAPKIELIRRIVSGYLSDDEKTLRLISLDSERKNRELADVVVKAEDAVKRIHELI